MTPARAILDAALDQIEEQADGISAVYQQRLSDYRRDLDALLADLAAGKVTHEQVLAAAEQGKNAIVSTLLAAGLEARAAAQTAALNVALAVLRAGIAALA